MRFDEWEPRGREDTVRRLSHFTVGKTEAPNDGTGLYSQWMVTLAFRWRSLIGLVLLFNKQFYHCRRRRRGAVCFVNLVC